MNAVYLRKSRSEDGMSTEEVLSKHKAALIELADKKGIMLSDFFEEVVSGESLSGRPEMLKLLKGVQAGRYDAVLCMDIDRLGRGGMADQGVILDAFRFSDTLIVTPDKTYDLTDEMDEELTEFKAFMARREYKMIRKRMQRGLVQTIQNGGYCANAPFGYRQCKIGKMPSLEIVEEEAYFIRYIFQRYLSGVGGATIAEELNAMGSSPRRSDTWTRNTVRVILRNPTFAGKVTWNKVKHYQPGTHGYDKHHVIYTPEADWIVYDGIHPPIISLEDWQAAQDIRRSRAVPSKKCGHTMNPFSGLIICPKCGKHMQKMGDNNGVPYILCTTKGCQAGAKLEYVEEHFISSLSDILESLKLRTSAADVGDLAACNAATNRVEKELERLNARLPRLYEFLEDGTYNRETFVSRMEAIEIEQKELLSKKAELQHECELIKARDLSKTIKSIDNVLKLYPTLDAEGKNMLLKTIVARIDYTKEKKTKPRDFTLNIHLRYL